MTTVAQEAEALPRERLRERQAVKLASQVRRVATASPLHAALYEAAKVRPEKVEGLEDLHRLPLLEKADLRRWGSERRDVFGGGACVAVDQLRIVNQSTGTSGSPTVYGLTANDVDVVAEIFAGALNCLGLRPGDVTPVAAMGYWHGWVIGLGLGLERLGAVPCRVAASGPQCLEAVLAGWADAPFTALRSYIPELELPLLNERGVNPAELFPEARFVYGGFDLSAPKRALIERAFGLPYRNSVGSGDQYFIGAECAHSAPYYHMPEEHFVFEVLDLETGEQVPPGGVGELVLTNLWAEGFPYLRYRMEDIVTYEVEPCACGRTTMRLRMLGRMAWSVQVGARRVFSGEVEDVLWRQPAFEGLRYQLCRHRAQPQGTLEVQVALDPTREAPARAELDRAGAALGDSFGVPAVVELIDAQGVGLQGSAKMTRVLDVE